MSDENVMDGMENMPLDMGAVGEDAAAEVATRKFLTFQTDNLLFGVDAEDVMEIITNHVITLVPMVPSYIRGIINLRGQTIPLIDMRLRLSIEPQENDCIIVLNLNEMLIGILVDTVCQIVDVPVDSILPVPAHNAQKYVSGMTKMPDGSGTMQVLDCALLIEG